MKKRHKDILISEIPNIDPNKSYGSVIWINDNMRSIPIESVKLYEFSHMYPHIMLMMHDEGISPIPQYIDRLRNFLQNEDHLRKSLPEADFILERTWMRSLYGILVRKKESIPGLISSYLNLIYGDILKDNSKDVIYIDTDNIFTKKEIQIDSPIPLRSYDIPVFYIESKKRYVYYDGNDVKHMGFRRREDDLRIITDSILKPIIRMDKIEKIGI